MPERHVYTIGYEGADLGSFLETLKSVGIRQVLDLRELPLSRKRGFSKTALADALAGYGMSYIHLRQLGDPKPGRDAARRGDHSGFRRIYRRHLAEPVAQRALAEAIRHACAMRSCLLCFERDHEACHRSIVAEAMAAAIGIEVGHLRAVPAARHGSQAEDDRRALHVW